MLNPPANAAAGGEETSPNPPGVLGTEAGPEADPDPGGGDSEPQSADESDQ